ncbi:MAG TPA: hypothetical protein VJI68_00795 [Candidatus Nanoarchaeia archaeon]|nr:hypothetical protein [Candidatus Nanoarchaeia archaeon]
MVTTELVLLYLILGGVIGIIWSLRRMYSLEEKIASLEEKITKKKKR